MIMNVLSVLLFNNFTKSMFSYKLDKCHGSPQRNLLLLRLGAILVESLNPGIVTEY